jgi:predicted DNA-binding protein
MVIQLPPQLKARLDALRRKGYTASGYIRSLLEKELAATKPPKKGR